MQIIRHTSHLGLLLTLLLTTIVYYPGLSGDFIFDDFPNLLKNKHLYFEDFNLDSIASATLSSGSGTFKRPVSMFSFAMNSYFFGMTPYSFKIVNLIIHLLAGVGVYLLTRLLIENYSKNHSKQFSSLFLQATPLFVCCVWLVHPLNLTSVLYIIQRMTSLSGLFVIWAACVYVITRTNYYDRRVGIWQLWLGFIVLGGLSILSKESGALLPLFLLLIEIFVFRFKTRQGLFDKNIIIFFAVTVLLPAILVLLNLLIKPEMISAMYDDRDFNVYERLLTETRALVFYLQMTIIPSISQLGIYHDNFTISSSLTNPPDTLASILILTALLLISIATIKKHSLFAFGIFWFFAAHILESTVIALELVHEHRNYVAIIGIIFSLAYLISRLSINRKHPSIKYILYITPIILLAMTTMLRSYQWSDNVLHAVYEARHHPDSPRAVFAEARIFANLAIFGNKEKTTEAYDKLARSAKLDARSIMPDVSLILLSHKLNLPIKQQWLESIKNKLNHYRLLPPTIAALKELVICKQRGCNLDNSEIEQILQIALKKTSRRHPDIITIYGQHVINNMNNFTKGETLFTEALNLAPHELQYRVNLIRLLIFTKQYDKVYEHREFLIKNNTIGKYHRLIKEIDEILQSDNNIDSGAKQNEITNKPGAN